MKSKPVVRYDKFTYELAGETHQVKQKLTRIAVLNGEEAKALNRARNSNDSFTMTYIGTKGKERMDFFEIETVESKIVETENDQ